MTYIQGLLNRSRYLEVLPRREKWTNEKDKAIVPRRIREMKKREKQYCREGELRSKKDKRNGEVPLSKGGEGK